VKKIAVLVLCVMVSGLIVTACASTPAGSLLGGFGPTMSNVNGDSVKVGTAESKVVLGWFGKYSFPPIKEAADKAGITKIATVEYYSKPGIFRFSTTYYTIVTGE